MVELIKPNQDKHTYVVGIDFGHAETSAALCEIEWGTSAEKREMKIEDIPLDRAQNKVITSSICRFENRHLIGEDAFAHMTDNSGIRIGFKQKPKSLDGVAECLMIDYMKAVYARICENMHVLEDGNHIVYIARPSGWADDNAKDLYKQMALKAGIPLAGLTSESRAAIFYAIKKNKFTKEISNGALVFDLGSSTLDLTYISDTSESVDYGYNLGASIIDEAILTKKILINNEVNEFVEKYPQYRDALKYKARKFKEEAYSKDSQLKTDNDFFLKHVLAEEEESYKAYANILVPLSIKNINELNLMVESIGYNNKLTKVIEDFRNTKISGKKINGVFLTGGASRMDFIRPLVAKHFDLQEKKVIRDVEPSLIVSRGIAMLGATDAITNNVLVLKLNKEVSALTNNYDLMDDFVKMLSSNIATQVWNNVVNICNIWVYRGKTTEFAELKEDIERGLKNFPYSRIHNIVDSTLQEFIEKHNEKIRGRMNEIITCYAPERRISKIENAHIDDVTAISKILDGMVSSLLGSGASSTSILEDLIGVLLYLISSPFHLLKGIWDFFFVEDKEKRRDTVDELFKNENETVSRLEETIREKLRQDKGFRNAVSSALNEYFIKFRDYNIQKVIIPIE